MDTNKIEKHVTLKAPLSRVWQAISDSQKFGTWFGVALDGPFVAGKKITGKMRPTKVDPEIAQKQAAYEGMPMEWEIDRIEPMRYFSYRWHPFAVDKSADYSKEPLTLVEFELEEAGATTKLTIRESGFEKLPEARRETSRKSNDWGWTKQAEMIGKYLEL
jgi:uncharacterized protein YndB with AHSA1/START domain